MACGDALLAKYGVASDGQTAEKPWDVFPGPGDYEDWRVAAGNMWSLMHRAFVALGAEEDKRVRAGTLLWENSHWNALVGDAGNDGTLRARLDAFSTPIVESFADWPSMSWDGSITAVVNLCRDIACTWEQIEAAIASYDPTKIPKRPGGPPRSGPGFDLWTVALIGGGLFLASRAGLFGEAGGDDDG